MRLILLKPAKNSHFNRKYPTGTIIDIKPTGFFRKERRYEIIRTTTGASLKYWLTIGKELPSIR